MWGRDGMLNTGKETCSRHIHSIYIYISVGLKQRTRNTDNFEFSIMVSMFCLIICEMKSMVGRGVNWMLHILETWSIIFMVILQLKKKHTISLHFSITHYVFSLFQQFPPKKVCSPSPYVIFTFSTHWPHRVITPRKLFYTYSSREIYQANLFIFDLSATGDTWTSCLSWSL